MLKVSCLCPTYNRAPNYLGLVEEAIESFLRQDYPNKELLILNDTPGQTLHFSHPQVRLVNTPVRFAGLGVKRNSLAGLATGELICPWDDDDISLPWRLSKSVELLGDADYYNPMAYWFIGNNGLRHDHALGWCYFASIYRRKTFDELGGYPNILSGTDYAMDTKLRTRHVAVRPGLPMADWYYIYRWGVSPAHLSSEPGGSFYETIGRLPIEAGEFTLTPHWEQDYAALTRAYAFAVRLEELER